MLRDRVDSEPGRDRHVFESQEDDNCETPKQAYQDVAPLLTWLAGPCGLRAALIVDCVLRAALTAYCRSLLLRAAAHCCCVLRAATDCRLISVNC